MTVPVGVTCPVGFPSWEEVVGTCGLAKAGVWQSGRGRADPRSASTWGFQNFPSPWALKSEVGPPHRPCREPVLLSRSSVSCDTALGAS